MNYYDILGIDRNATETEIKDAFNNMIKAFHPDLYRGKDKEFANKKTRELYEAYNVLKDPDKKREYDIRLNNTENGANYNRSYYNTSHTASSTNYRDYNNDNGNDGHPYNEQHSDNSADATIQNKYMGNKKSIVIVVALIAIIAGFFLVKSLMVKNEVTFAGTYIYDYYEGYNSDQELIETGSAEEDGVFNKFVIHPDGTVESYYRDSYAEGTWTVSDEAPEDMIMLSFDLSGDNEASLFDFLAINEKRNFAVYVLTYEDTTLFVYFDRVKE